MPMHDWTKVPDGVYHAHHFRWIGAIDAYLNDGHLPDEYYAQPEQRTGEIKPDIVTLKKRTRRPDWGETRTVTLPKPTTRFHAATEGEAYRRKQNRIAVRHVSGDRLVAVVEIVSRGNKTSRLALREFLDKAVDLLAERVHLLLIDPFPPTKRDPNGLHGAIWDELDSESFKLPKAQQLTLASYECGSVIEAYVEPFAVGDRLKSMPLFIEPGFYVNVPLEKTYMSAYRLMPKQSRVDLEK
jgi:hypothetical protein